MTDCQTSGRKLDEIRAQIAQKVGPEIANKMIHAYVALEINEIRPFADFGQSWMKSIGK
jgi:hypothetical protein